MVTLAVLLVITLIKGGGAGGHNSDFNVIDVLRVVCHAISAMVLETETFL